MTSLLLTGIGHLTTNVGEPIRDTRLLIEGGSIVAVDPDSPGPAEDTETIDCGGRAVIPGLVDSHTHLVFAGDRSDEFARRLSGVSYRQLAAEGGGILATVTETRAAPAETLFQLASRRVRRMIDGGTTTIEIKSGYGLDLSSELRLLQVARRIGEELPVTVKTTFLGAHAIPAEYRDRRGRYVDHVIEEMIPAVAGLADFCDVFVEDGAFTVDEAERILGSGLERGMIPRVHAEQLSHSGGAALAARLGAASADHLDHVTETDADALSAAGVVAGLVPGASYTLGQPQAPARMLLDHGVELALATDCNPGTSYFETMGLVISLAVVQMGLTVSEAIYAATRGGALSLGLDDRGLITPGAVADLVILDAPNPTHIAYRPASNLIWKTLKGGVVVAD
ncbi:MAG: imidazolonepropionase [Acidimicrobiia bacterium]